MTHDTPLLFASQQTSTQSVTVYSSNPRHYLYTLYDPLFVRRIDGFADKLRPVSVDFNSPTYVLHTYSRTYLCAITENGRGTLENKKVPFPICPRCTDPLPRCFAICIGLQCAACCFVSYAALSRVHVRDLSGFARQRFPYQIFISRMPVNRRRTRHRTAILGVYYVGIIWGMDGSWWKRGFGWRIVPQFEHDFVTHMFLFNALWCTSYTDRRKSG